MRKNRANYKGTPPYKKLPADLSAEILQAIMEYHNIFQVLKGKNLGYCNLRYSIARLSSRIERKIKNFSDKQQLNEFNNTTPTIKEILKGLF